MPEIPIYVIWSRLLRKPKDPWTAVSFHTDRKRAKQRLADCKKNDVWFEQRVWLYVYRMAKYMPE